MSRLAPPISMKTFALFLLLFTGCAVAAETMWKAGTASMKITPEELIWMAGYASRNKPAEGTAQELYAKALAIEDATGRRFVFVTLDLIGVPRTLRAALEKRLAESHRLPPEALLLNASHTHCGPEIRVAGKPGIFVEIGRKDQAEAYGRTLETKLFTLVSEALAGLAPAQLSYHRARCGFAMNRRLPVENAIRNSPYPEGPVDHDVPVLRVADAAGKVRALLFGYACHNTTLNFYQWCGDYAGYAQEYLEADNPGTVALFMMGCGGDQNPYPRRNLSHAQFHGRALATAVEAALAGPARPISGPLESKLADVKIDFAHVPTRAELEEKRTLPNKLDAAHAQRLLDRLDREGSLPAHYAFPVQVVRFGNDLTFIGLAGETVVDFSLRLKRELAGAAPVWVAGYCNDVMGYIPSRRVLIEGGYEGGDAMKHSTLPGAWTPDVEERIVGQVHALLKSLAP